ncbi:MAG TPA: putative sugar nucleotidyl transferase [Gemmatimonadaceae bacterium]|nr:putative sugar nucleotidyl transferase [Gemmatimonadaceae bacterium]
MSELYFHDDAVARQFEPFVLTRPVCELRAGALLIRERWAEATGFVPRGFISTELGNFDEPWGIPAATGTLRKGSILANARCAVSLAPAPAADTWVCDGRVAAVTLRRDVETRELSDGSLALEDLVRKGGRRVEVQGWWLDHVWDLIAHLPAMLGPDIASLARPAFRMKREDVLRAGTHEVFIEPGGAVEPQVFFDCSAGPVLVREGATVQAFTRIVGPCVIGKHSQVGGDKIATCSIGDVCKVHGEVSTSIFIGHSNKGHDGFLGHSYLGRWVNLGAGTITSNLKNTYGHVAFWTPEGEMDSGMQFLGTFFGDHAKTGIGTSLNTGTVIGAAANVYGSTMPPKMVPPFAWGDRTPYSTYRMDKFLEVAKRMMERRHVELSSKMESMLTAAFKRAAGLSGPR